MSISRNTLDSVYSIPVSQIVSKYVTLKEERTNFQAYIGLCPFHDEKTPSFKVNDKKGIFKCFGCGQGGNGVRFHELQNPTLHFHERIKDLCNTHNINYETDDKPFDLEEYTKHQKLKSEQNSLSEKVTTLYFEAGKAAPDNHPFKAFVAERGYTDETITNYRIGFAEGKNSIVIPLAKDWQENTDTAIEIGFVNRSESVLSDKFKFRVTYPYTRRDGSTTAITARTLSDNPDIPKWINNKNSESFWQKGNAVFGLFQALPAIRETGHAILVEGADDVCFLSQCGAAETVCGSGTIVTHGQLKEIRKHTDILWIFMDLDEAGILATDKVLKMALETELKPYVIDISGYYPTPRKNSKKPPPTSDPAQWARDMLSEKIKKKFETKGQDWTINQELEGLKKEAISLTVDSILKNKTEDKNQQIAAYEEIADFLALIKNETLRGMWIADIGDSSKTKALTAAKLLKMVQAIIDKQQTRQTKRETKRNNQDEEVSGLTEHRIYVKDNSYWVGSQQLSNFIFKRPFIQIHHDKLNSSRYVQIINQKGVTKSVLMPAAKFAQPGAFKDAIHNAGNYRWKEIHKLHYFQIIFDWLFDNFTEADEVTEIGKNFDFGIWVWGNGISTREGKFYTSDEFGVVEIEGHNFFLPADSPIYKEHKTFNKDKFQNPFRNNHGEFSSHAFHHFIDNDTTISGFVTQALKVFKPKYFLPLFMYDIAAIYRDMILYKRRSFPLAYTGGAPESGKSTINEVLSFLWGQQKTVFSLTGGSFADFKRSFQSIANGTKIYNEFGNEDMIFDPEEGFKSSYDGEPYTHRDTNNRNRQEVLHKLNAPKITGQGKIKQEALKRRLAVFLWMFREDKGTENDFQDLMKIVRKGLTHLTHLFFSHSDLIWEHFDATFAMLDKQTKTLVKTEIDRRTKKKKIHIDFYAGIVDNITVLLTVFLILKEKAAIDFGFRYDDLSLTLTQSAANLMADMQTGSSTGKFWRLFTAAKSSGFLNEGEHFKAFKSKKPGVDTELRIWFPQAYTRINKHFPNDKLLSEENLDGYLQNMDAFIEKEPRFIGKKEGKDKTVTCHVFDISKLDTDIQPDVEF